MADKRATDIHVQGPGEFAAQSYPQFQKAGAWLGYDGNGHQD